MRLSQERMKTAPDRSGKRPSVCIRMRTDSPVVPALPEPSFGGAFQAGERGYVARVKDIASNMIVLQITMWKVLSLYGELCAPFCTLIWDRASRTWVY